ncbi:peptide synthase [Paraburkholderia sp. Tr-20389]|uniref:TauD/TfdA family dioxygenase n=1 Tax=Paraburkholderia sp. Tr-20389 TaxID=2703903 RepID=UPI00197E8040|nr:TauD/TfdA family dioxygenase [Paraburkholderia sp. Tr-20389]MBN3758338.1 peptide synthase [Paraburkholderia sp. Tr-20389]
MKDFDIAYEHDSARVPVRGRQYLAGSTSVEVPESIPMANDMVLALRAATHNWTLDEAAHRCRAAIDEALYDRGAILFRALPLNDRKDFDAFMRALGYAPSNYSGGIAVRRHDAGYALMASQEDPRISMAPHNEMAYLPGYPRKVFFCCAAEGTAGGEVPINDIRLSVAHIPTDVLDTFRQKGIRYYRSLPQANDAQQIGWMETFGVERREDVEMIMRDKGYDFTWRGDGRLSYSYAMPAFVAHPDTGEALWFNQVTELHCSYWRDHPHFPSDLADDEYPATTRYGDGSPIPDALIVRLRAALWKPARAVKMRKGDVLALDNQVIQHGRIAFEGPRQHLVSITA